MILPSPLPVLGVIPRPEEEISLFFSYEGIKIKKKKRISTVGKRTQKNIDPALMPLLL